MQHTPAHLWLASAAAFAGVTTWRKLRRRSVALPAMMAGVFTLPVAGVALWILTW